MGTERREVQQVIPANPFTSNMIVAGNTVYLSGVVGVDEEGKFVEGSIGDRTRAALGVARRRLANINLDLGDGWLSSLPFFSSPSSDCFVICETSLEGKSKAENSRQRPDLLGGLS